MISTAFTWVGGRPSVDFTGTVGKRRHAAFERMPAPADLTRWFHEAGLGDATATARTYAQAVELREALYRLFTGPARPEDLAVVNRWSARPLAGPQLTADHSATNPPTTAQALLSILARDAIDLLSGPLAARIRTCEAEECSLLFVDTSRPGTRRWCSMNLCGARAKMATYRAAD